ncbi:MAG: helZ2 [Proteobacteria bacterium]|nr:helZ2 [Pseudomonadota bacterium]
MSISATDILAPLLTPHGHLLLVSDSDAPSLPASVQQRLTDAFALGSGHGLLRLGAAEVGSILPPSWAWWRDFAARYVTALCATPEAGVIAPPGDEVLDCLIADAPPMTGVEYLTTEVLRTLWKDLDAALRNEVAAAKVPLQEFLKARHAVWNLVGRVYFNLAENRKDPEAPFAFLATYTSQVSAYGRAQHLPLSQALTEFSDGKSQARLLSLLIPVQRAAQQSGWLRAMVDSGDIYHPLRWQPADAYQFLTDVPKLEAAGIIVRAPGTWQAGRPARPLVKASVGARPPSLLGKEALLDFSLEVTLDGERLSAGEIKALLSAGNGLQLIRGRWVEVDGKKLGRMLDRFQAIEQAAAEHGLPFAQAMRLVAGASLEDAGDAAAADWSQMVAGPWLAETLQGLRQPEGLAQISPGPELKATLRPYQQAGLRWLYLLTRLGLGACLADDMGLGKTIQVLSLLLVLKREHEESRPSLLVAPASLLANWAADIPRRSRPRSCERWRQVT